MTKSASLKLDEMRREEAVRNAGFERRFFHEGGKGVKSIHACSKCGSLPRTYSHITPKGEAFNLVCLMCGNCADESVDGKQAVKNWNAKNEAGTQWDVTSAGFYNPQTKILIREVYGEDGITTIEESRSN